MNVPKRLIGALRIQYFHTFKLNKLFTAKPTPPFRCLPVLLALAFFNPVVAQLPDPKVRVCNCDSGSEFAWHAENAAMNELPLLFEGAQDVYLANPATQDVRVFTVTRQSTGTSVGFGDEYWTTEVVPGIGDPQVVNGLSDLIAAFHDFEASIQGTIRLVDQPDPPQPPIDSAFDLVGPEDSSASFNRGVLNNWMSDLASRRFTDAVDAADSGDFGDSFLEVFSAAVQAILDFLGPNAAVWIEFADGTKGRVDQQETLTSIDPATGGIDGLEFNYEVDPSTAQASDLDNVPQSPGEFAGSSYSGGSAGELGRLALRLGISLEFGSGEEDCEGAITCVSVDGGEPHCTTTLSSEQIASGC